MLSIWARISRSEPAFSSVMAAFTVSTPYRSSNWVSLLSPLAGTLADYLLPGAVEMPAIKIGHLHTPTPHTEYGMKGMGEGGAVAPPAAIANAVRDALLAIGAEVNEMPITPRRVMAAIARAQSHACAME